MTLQKIFGFFLITLASLAFLGGDLKKSLIISAMIFALAILFLIIPTKKTNQDNKFLTKTTRNIQISIVLIGFLLPIIFLFFPLLGNKIIQILISLLNFAGPLSLPFLILPFLIFLVIIDLIQKYLLK